MLLKSRIPDRPATVDIVHVVFRHECGRLKHISHRTVKYTNPGHSGTECDADTTLVIVGNSGDLPSTASTVMVLGLGRVRHWILITGVQVKTTGRIVVGIQINVCPFQPFNYQHSSVIISARQHLKYCLKCFAYIWHVVLTIFCTVMPSLSSLTAIFQVDLG